MPRIVIEDLPILEELSQEEMASIVGGSISFDPDLGTPPPAGSPTGTGSS
jgi:bacteriocin-like protein